MNTKNPIDQILKTREEQISAEEEEKKRAQQQAADLLVEELKNHIGPDLWAIFSAVAKPTYSAGNKDVSISMEIPALDEYQLAPIDIAWNRYSGSGNYNDYPFRTWGNSSKKLDVALAHAREAYPRYKADQKEKLIKEQTNTLNHWSGTKDPDKAESAYEKLVEIDPDKQAEWKEYLAQWHSTRAEEARRAEENARENSRRKEAERRYQELRTSYINQLVLWLKEKESILARNQTLAEVIQEKHNTPYEVGRLTYGVSATDEETSERVIETRYVYVIGSADQEGYWWNGEKYVKYFNLVSLEKMDVAADDNILSIKFIKGGVKLFFHPALGPDYIEEATKEILPLPDKPEAPGDLSYYDASEKCESEARAIIAKERGETVEEPDSRWQDF